MQFIGGAVANALSLTGTSVSFKVTPEVLTAKSAEAAKSVSAMREHFEELRRLVDKTKSYWVGEAGDKHREMYYALEEDTEEILKRLGEHPVDLVAIAQKYTDTELKIQQEIQELPGDVII